MCNLVCHKIYVSTLKKQCRYGFLQSLVNCETRFNIETTLLHIKRTEK